MKAGPSTEGQEQKKLDLVRTATAQHSAL